MHPGGEPAGYIIELENGKKFYHAGDTGVFADMAFIVFINGCICNVDNYRGILEAVQLAYKLENAKEYSA